MTAMTEEIELTYGEMHMMLPKGEIPIFDRRHISTN